MYVKLSFNYFCFSQGEWHQVTMLKTSWIYFIMVSTYLVLLYFIQSFTHFCNIEITVLHILIKHKHKGESMSIT